MWGNVICLVGFFLSRMKDVMDVVILRYIVYIFGVIVCIVLKIVIFEINYLLGEFINKKILLILFFILRYIMRFVI